MHYMLSVLFQADMKELEFALVGSGTYAARFGETITNLGDIDDDGFSGKPVKIWKLSINFAKYVLCHFACICMKLVS